MATTAATTATPPPNNNNNSIHILPDKTYLTLNTSNSIRQSKILQSSRRTPAAVSFKSLSNNNFGTDTPSDKPVDQEIFTSKHTNSLIDIKKAYYDIIDNDIDKQIFISYETNANIQERKFIVDLVRQLKENFLNDDIWFDRDELIIGKPTWTVCRLEAAENSNAAVMIVTPSYFENPLSVYESKALYDHKCCDEDFYLAIIVLYIKGYPRLINNNSSILNDNERIRARKIVQNFSLLQPLIDKSNIFINLSDPKYMPMSIAEKVSHCVGALTNNLDKYGKSKRPAPPMTPFDESDNILNSSHETFAQNTPYTLSFSVTSLSIYSIHTNYVKNNNSHNNNNKIELQENFFNKNYLFKSLIMFKPNDVQQMLEDIGIDEYYRNNLAEYRVDGYLLTTISDEDLNYIFDIDNKMARKKIRTSVAEIIQREVQSGENWHLQLKYLKPTKLNSVYLIFDPQDHLSLVPFINELKIYNIDVYHHHGFGTSKEEFMKLNVSAMAKCRFVFVYLTETAASSNFVVHECTFSNFLINKPKIITIMVKNVWKSMRHTLKAMLGDQLALDFTNSNLKANMKPLLQFFKPKFNTYEPLVKLERTNTDDGTLKSLDLLANTSSHPLPFLDKIKVFISQVTDQWETQRRLEQLLSSLETFNIKCWFDLFSIESQRTKNPLTRSLNNFDEYNKSSQLNTPTSMNNNLNIKTAQVLICCITPKYLSSDICIKDVNLADALHIPIIPLLLKPSAWPPDNIQFHIRRVLIPLKCIDISNDALLKRNLPLIINTIHQSATKFTKNLAKQNSEISSEQPLISNRSINKINKK